MDARKKKVLTVLCIGSVILGWRVYVLTTPYLPASAQADSNPLAPPASNAKVPPPQDGEHSDPILTAQRRVGEQGWGRDPFSEVPWAADQGAETAQRPLAVAPATPEPPSLAFTGVSRSGDQWLAAIQNEIVRVGDRVEGRFRVIAIDQHSITLQSTAWTFQFELGSPKAVVRPYRRNDD